MEIDDLEAGRGMDALIAERIFGWKNLIWDEGRQVISESGLPTPHTFWIRGWHGDSPNGKRYLSERYSTNIADAWKVVDKLREACCDFSISEGFSAAFLKDEWIVATADTVPVAIRRAGLMAVVGKNNDMYMDTSNQNHNPSAGSNLLDEFAGWDRLSDESLSHFETFPKEEWRGGLLATIVTTMIVVALYGLTWLWRRAKCWSAKIH